MSRPGTITVLTGPPGSGKTTVAGPLADSFERSVHIVADEFWRWLRSGFVPAWLPESHTQNVLLTRIAARTAAAYADGGYDVVLDGMFGPWLLDEFLAAVDGNPVRYVVLRPDVETAVARAVARKAPDLVDEAPIRHMHQAFADLGDYEPYALDTTALQPAETRILLRERLLAGRHDLP